jgi:hypothetical protein
MQSHHGRKEKKAEGKTTEYAVLIEWQVKINGLDGSGVQPRSIDSRFTCGPEAPMMPSC